MNNIIGCIVTPKQAKKYLQSIRNDYTINQNRLSDYFVLIDITKLNTNITNIFIVKGNFKKRLLQI